MRWDSLFDDLTGQLDDELDADDAGVRLEAERARRGRLTLRDRLLALQNMRGPGRPLTIELVDGATWRLCIRGIGTDWLHATAGATDGREVVVPLHAVAAVALTPQQVDRSLDELGTGEPRLIDRLTISYLLRDLCRRRAGVVVHTRRGRWSGTIDRVGRDHLDLAVHEVGAVRRSTAVAQIRVIAMSEVVIVERGR